jgi:propionate CoA-transferase
VKEGPVRKFITHVEQLSYSAQQAHERGQQVLYVTERAVFELTPRGLRLKEVAPGIDMRTQVLDLMDFKPIVEEVGVMKIG